MIAMPFERIAAGVQFRIRRHSQKWLAVEGIVPVAVLPAFADQLRNAYVVLAARVRWVDGDQAPVEQRVELLGQNETVTRVIALRAQVRLNVRSVEDGLGVLAGDRAGAIGIEKAQPECALSFAHCLLREHPLTFIDYQRYEGIEELRRWFGGVPLELGQ